VALLRDVADIQLGKMLSPAAKHGVRPLPYLRNANVQWDHFDLADVAEMDFTEAEEAKFRLRVGDVLVVEGGEPGRAAVWDASIERICYQKAVHRIRPRDGRLDPEFLVFRLWAGGLRGEFTSGETKTTIAHLPLVRLERVAVPLPPLTEQRRVAARLREQLHEVDGLAASATAQDEELAHLRTRVYETAFPVTPLSVTAESASPDGWAWYSLGSLGRLESGHTPSRSRPDWWGGDIPWIALPDIRALDGRYTFETLERTNPEGIAHSAARILPAGTVVLSRTASVGFVTIMGRPMATSQDFVNWVCGPDLDPEFLMHLFIRSRERFRSLSAGAVHQTVYFPTAMALRVCMPSVDAQRQIVARLREELAEIDQAKVALHAGRKAIDALPAALLREVFGASPVGG
jgi:type I restriction enzyme, S subunit